MNKLSPDTLNEIDVAKGQAKYTGYFWIAIAIFHISILLLVFFDSETKNYLLITIFAIFTIFIEFIFIYLSLFKFSRFVSVISPIIILLILVAPYFFNTELPLDLYYSTYKENLIDKNIARDASQARIITLILLPFLPLFCFYKGIKGSFAYHKLMKEEK
ncbi:hypothetical protein OAJ30_01165 [Alphaproteobacteria bacterium]|nr:hypothetical protein [Alphaproteobacteria bacterium]